MNLTAKMLIFLGLGIGTGLFFGEEAAILGVLGDGYVGLLQMTVLPFIAFSLVANIGRFSIAEGRSLARAAVIVLALLWAVALVSLFVVPSAFPALDVGSGSSELHGVVGALRVSAGGGRIVVDDQQKGIWKLDTDSGSVTISLPEDAAFELDAESGSGGIDIDHPLTVQGKISKRHIRGQVRGGGDLLGVETGSGSIPVE